MIIGIGTQLFAWKDLSLFVLIIIDYYKDIYMPIYVVSVNMGRVSKCAIYSWVIKTSNIHKKNCGYSQFD